MIQMAPSIRKNKAVVNKKNLGKLHVSKKDEMDPKAEFLLTFFCLVVCRTVHLSNQFLERKE